MIEPPLPGMKRLITISFAVDQEGDHFVIHNSTQNEGTWAESYVGMLEVEKDIKRQIEERFNCPFHPKNIKTTGTPEFQD